MQDPLAALVDEAGYMAKMVWGEKLVCYGEHERSAPSMMSVAKTVSRSTTTVPPPLKRLINGMPAAFNAGMSTKRSGFLLSRQFSYYTGNSHWSVIWTT